MKKSRYILGFLSIIFFAAFLIHPAFAAEKGIIKSKETVVPEHQKVEHVIVFGNDAHISGSVKNAVIVINGNLDIKRTANIHGFVLVVGGQIKQQAGAHVTEDIMSLNLNNKMQNSLILGIVLLLGNWLLRLAGSIVLVLITILAGILLRKRLNPADIINKQVGRFMATGAIASLAIIAVTLLLLITIIGIPIGAILLLYTIISLIIGMAVLSKAVAERINGINDKPDWLLFLTGAILIVSVFNFPLIGFVIFLIVTWLSLGFSMKWIFDKITTRKR
ncbi:hypothetical protein [Scopulibacillus cellulosilyticus]|uniref:Cytoskeletal protein CcmA (Bactofilin family) n=1 Tax=Scopulibacillus cellulosilyticus TaxID=2665665 RepID=A0ABW2PUT9_9BACL